MRSSFLISLLIGCCYALQAQEKTYTIPFTLTDHNNISIRAVLNHQDTLDLMLHTAESGVTLTEAATKQLHSLKFEGSDSVKSWGGNGASRYSKNNTLQIGELSWEHMMVWEDERSGQHTDGKFGLDLFKDKVIEINFDKKLVIIYSSLPRKTRRYEKCKLTFSHNSLYLEAACKIGDSLVPNKYLVHSGYSGSILLDDQFAEDHKLTEKLTVTDGKVLHDSYGHELKTEKAIAPQFAIGKMTLASVPVGFFHGAIGAQKISVIGGDILKRFNMIIDARREYIYLRPDRLKKTVYMS